MSFVIRRSIPSLTGLVALLVGVGMAAAVSFDFPLWFPGLFALACVAVQFAVAPWLIRKLVPAIEIEHDGSAYATEMPLGRIVADRCREAGIPLVRLGLVDDGTPNAFTFGRTPRDAHVWISRGLLDRLDEDELDAVVAHEIGHVRNWDFAVMTVASAVPLFLYTVYVIARGNRREGFLVAVAAYVAYLLSQLVLLALSRARELAADHWSCAVTADGDALASALVKVAYGIAEAQAAHDHQVAQTAEREGKKAARQLDAEWRQGRSVDVLGIFDAGQAVAIATVMPGGVPSPRAEAAMRWDLVNPWGALLEKLSSHPLVPRRIEALTRSGLPGAPTTWGALVERAKESSVAERSSLVRRFAGEVVVSVAPWVALVGGLAVVGAAQSRAGLGGLLVLAGVLFLAKQSVRYPSAFVDVGEVASLLERVDASPVRGIAVTVRGSIMGRGMPGYVLSPDMVVQDESGFVPLLYRQPIPFAREWFGFFKVRRLMGQDVVARGWYRRSPSPVVELRSVVAADGRSASCWEWFARYAASAALVALGLLLMAAGAGG